MIMDDRRLNSVRYGEEGEVKKIFTFEIFKAKMATTPETLMYNYRVRWLKFLRNDKFCSKILLPLEEGYENEDHEYFIHYPAMGRPFSSLMVERISKDLRESTFGDPYNLVAEGLVDATSALEEIHKYDLVHGCISARMIFFEPQGKG